MRKDTFNIKNRNRFRELVEGVPSRCWLWKGNLSKGYARFYLPEKQQEVYAHRWSWELANGPIPSGFELHHKCKNKACVNPQHLELISHRDHMRLHGRLGVWSGESNGQSKRTETDILVIKFLNSYLFLPARHISKAMKIPERSIYSILSGESWKSIQLPKDFGD